jgi:hypothetical protein
MSFLRHAGIYRSDDSCLAGSELFASLPALIGLDEFQPVIPWQVALQQSQPLLHRPRLILNNPGCRTMLFQQTTITPLSDCLSPGVHSTIAVPCSTPHPRSKINRELTLGLVHQTGHISWTTRNVRFMKRS